MAPPELIIQARYSDQLALVNALREIFGDVKPTIDVCFHCPKSC